MRAVKAKITDEIMKSRYLAAKEFLALPKKEPEKPTDGVLPQTFSDPKQAASFEFPLDEAAISQALK